MKTGQRIPIKTAKEIANNLGYSQVIIFAYDGSTGIQSICTFGKTKSDCETAADSGNKLKKTLGWPDEFCHAKPSRSK